MICVVHAHPYPSRPRTDRVLADALRALPDVDLRPLYELYPDFDIDVFATGREELREFFARDRAQFETEHRTGWNRD